MENFSCDFPTPHSNAYIDLNGDCLADLFLMCKTSKFASGLSYQIWTSNKVTGVYALALEEELPEGTKGVRFADMGQYRLVLDLIAHL
jgi:integrin alpha FG-GAP repeat containing protein 1